MLVVVISPFLRRPRSKPHLPSSQFWLPVCTQDHDNIPLSSLALCGVQRLFVWGRRYPWPSRLQLQSLLKFRLPQHPSVRPSILG
jgi:hypothetical protein